MRRREWLQITGGSGFGLAGLASLSGLAGLGSLQGCTDRRPELTGDWVGVHPERGHRLRAAQAMVGDGPLRRTRVLIVGGGIAGLACARTLARAGVDDIALLELEDQAGGNSRGHQLAGHACPLGAHYLPVPGADAPEVYQLLEELGLVRQQLGRAVWDERHLCHSPQERLFYEGHWLEGLVPPPTHAGALEQYRRFASEVLSAQQVGFAMPASRAPWTAAHATLDAQPFARWLDQRGLVDAGLRWYLDYCCRDDFGAGAATVSAWAGLHYFASRHGFHAPGDDSAEREPVLTWPEGNGWLSQRLAQDLSGRVHTGRIVLKAAESRHGVEVLAWDEGRQSPERWEAEQLVLATPLFVAARLLEQPGEALRAAVQQQRHAPWLVANLLLGQAPVERVGVPRAWDNVVYGSASLGYVDARHQDLSPLPDPTVLSLYWALPQFRRASLLNDSWQVWADHVLAELAPVHPDIAQQVQRIDLARWGHAMSIPTPGLRGSAALTALRGPQTGRIHHAHADLAGYSVFEEAYTVGVQTARQLLAGGLSRKRDQSRR